MTRQRIDRLTAAEWATTPLRSPENIGRKVWFSWNGNVPSAVLITEVTRVGVRIDTTDSPQRGFKISPVDPGIAHRTINQWQSSIFTEQYRLDTEEQADLIGSIKQATLWHLPIESLRKIKSIIEGEG